jgi:hypothetical protein
MINAVIPLLVAGGIVLWAVTKKKKTVGLPKLLSEDCSRALVTARQVDENMAILRWGTTYLAANPFPPVPSDPDTLRGHIARYVLAVFEEGAPHCMHLFDTDLETWPHGARVLFEQMVYSSAIALEAQGYNVAVPKRPPTF